jgi:hypothetical protein
LHIDPNNAKNETIARNLGLLSLRKISQKLLNFLLVNELILKYFMSLPEDVGSNEFEVGQHDFANSTKPGAEYSSKCYDKATNESDETMSR